MPAVPPIKRTQAESTGIQKQESRINILKKKTWKGYMLLKWSHGERKFADSNWARPRENVLTK